MQAYLKRNVVPLIILIIISFSTIVISVTLLNKNQTTVQIAVIPLHAQASATSPTIGTVTKGMRLKIIKTDANWSLVRQPNEKVAWAPTWLLNRKTPLKALTPLAERTIMLDAGHGGSDTGAIANTGQFEKTYTLKTALATKAILESYGANVIMTRTQDKLVYLANIPTLAEKNHADASISFHFDSAPEKNLASGLTTYYYHQNNDSYRLAKTLNAQFNDFPIPNRGVEFGDFLVIRRNMRPAVLLEMGYINSNTDFKTIKSANYQTQVAQAIHVGLENYFKSTN